MAIWLIASPGFRGDGKTYLESVFFAFMALRIAIASSDRGTKCSSFIFILRAGTIHTSSSIETSDHSICSTSDVRLR